MAKESIEIPDLGVFQAGDGMIRRARTSDGLFRSGHDGVTAIASTGDGKVEFVAWRSRSLALVKSAMGYPAYYPVLPVSQERPVKAVLMDLDGTSVRSEGFWVWIIQLTTAGLLGNPAFELEEADLPFVSGHSVSEHLQYCIRKYCPGKTVEEARTRYFEHTHREMKAILDGGGRPNAFTPSPGLKPFLLDLKRRGIRIGLVTSGLHEKAWPEIVSAFRTLGMGDPNDFYDAVITAGHAIRKGAAGTLGELSPKPHPWLYAEVARVGLGLPIEDRNCVIGLEDSGAGICSVRLAGFVPVGMADGNIEESGTRALCHHYCENFEQIAELL